MQLTLHPPPATATAAADLSPATADLARPFAGAPTAAASGLSSGEADDATPEPTTVSGTEPQGVTFGAGSDLTGTSRWQAASR